MVTTNDDRVAERLRALRVHGSQAKYVYEWVGLNSRLDALQAAVLSVKIEYLDGWTAGRQRNAALYTRKFLEAGAPVITSVAAPYQTRHIYNQYDAVIGALAAATNFGRRWWSRGSAQKSIIRCRCICRNVSRSWVIAMAISR